jgi:hypothetical protein
MPAKADLLNNLLIEWRLFYNKKLYFEMQIHAIEYPTALPSFRCRPKFGRDLDAGVHRYDGGMMYQI